MQKKHRQWNPLDGILVADFSAQLPGAIATGMLADLGANVIKIEPHTGDFARQIPGGIYERTNRNKRSLTLDLKNSVGREVALRLVGAADVILESWRPGVASRLGLDAETTRAAFPRLIYCSLSGYGQEGPMRSAVGHDLGYLAASGLMSIAGQWGRPPSRSAAPVADLAGGLFAASAILGALFERQTNGQGRRIDLSLYESTLYCAGLRSFFDIDAIERSHLSPTNDVYETADGRTVALSILENAFWVNFVEIVGSRDPELLAERFKSPQDRYQNGDELAGRLASLFRAETAESWEHTFKGRDVPLHVCLTPREAASAPQAVAVGALVQDGRRFFCHFPAIVDGMRSRGEGTSAPALGADSDSTLRSLGYSSDDVSALRAKGALGPERKT